MFNSLDWLLRFFPDPMQAVQAGAIGFVFIVIFARTAGYFRTVRTLRVPYTRKIFHFLIITGAGIIQLLTGLGGVSVYGSIVALLVLYAVYRGEGFSLYDAMGRPSDAPRQSLFIVIPLIMTALGGIISNIFFWPWATVGYWVCGWGDAVGEPVGARWGNHPYEVPSLAGVPAHRTLEGSLAVGLVGTVAAIAALTLQGTAFYDSLVVGLACGIAGMFIEAISNHGLDNFTIQVGVAGVAYWLV